MSTRIIRITECYQCPHSRASTVRPQVFFCAHGLKLSECPPTGIPDWCPLEKLEERGGEK